MRYMKKIKLNENLGRKTSIDEYILDPTEKYVIDIEEEMEFQVATMKVCLEIEKSLKSTIS